MHLCIKSDLLLIIFNQKIQWRKIGWLVDKIADDKNQYDIFNVNEEVENVMNIINQLSEEDKNLITNLLIKNKTERELSALMGVSQPAIHKRKKRIIENIKNKSKK